MGGTPPGTGPQAPDQMNLPVSISYQLALPATAYPAISPIGWRIAPGSMRPASGDAVLGLPVRMRTRERIWTGLGSVVAMAQPTASSSDGSAGAPAAEAAVAACAEGCGTALYAR